MSATLTDEEREFLRKAMVISTIIGRRCDVPLKQARSVAAEIIRALG